MNMLSIIFLIEVNCLKNYETDFILAFLKEYDVKHCFFLVCWSNFDKVKLTRMIMEQRHSTSIAFLPTKKGSVSSALDEGYSKITYILDLNCKGVSGILNESSANTKFTLTKNWLMLANENISLHDIRTSFDSIDLRMDSHIKVIFPKNNGTYYDIYEAYDPGLEVDCKIIKMGYFANGKFINFENDRRFFQSRKNMSGVLIRNANWVDFTDELLWRSRNLFDYDEKGGLYTLYLHHLFPVLAELLQFNYNTTVLPLLFGPSESGIDAGVAKLLHEKKLDIQVGGAVATVARLRYIDILIMPYMEFKTSFFYRSPGIKKIGTQVMTPLAPEVWYCTLATLVITGLLIKLVYYSEFKFLRSKKTYSFSTLVLTVVATLTLQGYAAFPRNSGIRIVFTTLLVFSILIYNYYTSGLVSSLLNSKPDMLATLQDLYESRLEIGMEDQVYAHQFINHSHDYYLKLLYQKKILKIGGTGESNVFSAKAGVEMVRKGGLAFHMMIQAAYTLISKTFDQKTICDLGEIPVFSFTAGMAIQKNFQYKEMFAIGFTKMWENGLTKQVYEHMGIRKPECHSTALMTAVGLQELFLVYVIFIVGILLAIGLVIVEIIFHKMQKKKQKVSK